MSIHSVQYSIIKFLDDNVPELNKVIWLLPDTTYTASDLPLATVEEIYSANQTLDKLADYGSKRHYLQIDLKARNATELAKLRDKIENLLMGTDVPHYDTTQPAPPPTIGDLRVEVNLVNVSLPDNIADTVNKYVVNIDISVYVNLKF
jgi:hypothetical protein